MGPLSSSRSFRFFLAVLWLCFTDVVRAQDQGQPPANQSGLGYPYDQPWTTEKKPKKTSGKKTTPGAQETPTTQPPAQPVPESAPATPPVVTGAPPAATEESAAVSTPALQKPTVAKNEISASGDFLYGTGRITVPLGYSLAKSLGNLAQVPVGPVQVSRNSDYFGGTISYSYLHGWFVDFSYARGTSTGGGVPANAGFLGSAISSFTIDDDWYQVYLRYAFPALRGKRFSAYLRAGFSYVHADLTMDANTPSGIYHQSDTTEDYLGNAGFGVGYSLYATRHFIISLQGEGEGFFGTRSQQSTETLSADAGLAPVTAQINNTLYGLIGRGTVQFEYRLGQANRFRVFAQGGAQAKYTEITYPSAGTSSELLWGPYAKLGLRYSF